ncbi:MAG TPA: hypothetical protein VF490_18815 [Chryseosolibacter sp.]
MPVKKCIYVLAFLLFIHESAFAQVIHIDGSTRGKTFEGVGAVSAGASSRLLKDYPKRLRNDVLDFLFKPRFGAGLQHLKVEVGGDINSTAGTEPSHARTREELIHPKKKYFRRGYEFWLMREAKKRNRDILFDCLEWGAPGWFRGGFYSQDNADYIAAFIKGAEKYNGVDIRYTGTWNEKRSPQNRDWIVHILRTTLNKNGLQEVGIVADDWYTPRWQFAREVVGDTALKNALYALGYHYVNSTTTDTARMTGLRLWESEGWSKSGEWPNAMLLARQINRNYVKGKITKTLIWNPADAYYDNVSWPGIGAMTASTPWSGHYQVEPAIWALAHTTQFAQPGWVYVESGCDSTAHHTCFVTLKAPSTDDYSLIITSGKVKETLTFQIANLSLKKLHVWKSDSTDQFIRQEDIVPVNGSFSIPLEPDAIYSLTTTTGQQKGAGKYPVPAETSFPRSYSEDFEAYHAGETPRYISDQGGAFEVCRLKGESKALRQVVTGARIPWDTWGPNDPEPFTEFGDFYADYSVSTDALIEHSGTVKIVGRARYFESNKGVHGYGLIVDEKGEWKLMKFMTPLASGKISFGPDEWHSLKLTFKGATITAFVDGREIVSVSDTTYQNGYAGIGSGWNHARFDNIVMDVK